MSCRKIFLSFFLTPLNLFFRQRSILTGNIKTVGMHLTLNFFVSSSAAQQRLSLPWTGFSFYADEPISSDKLSIFAVNAVGQLFVSQLGVGTPVDEDSSSDLDLFDDRDEPAARPWKADAEIGPRLREHLSNWNLKCQASRFQKVAR